MDKKTIEQRLAELRNSHTQLLKDALAHEGAIADCQFWLSKLDEAERTDGKNNTE